jgi:hypothetical protein
MMEKHSAKVSLAREKENELDIQALVMREEAASKKAGD